MQSWEWHYSVDRMNVSAACMKSLKSKKIVGITAKVHLVNVHFKVSASISQGCHDFHCVVTCVPTPTLLFSRSTYSTVIFLCCSTNSH